MDEELIYELVDLLSDDTRDADDIECFYEHLMDEIAAHPDMVISKLFNNSISREHMTEEYRQIQSKLDLLKTIHHQIEIADMKIGQLEIKRKNFDEEITDCKNIIKGHLGFFIADLLS